MEFQWVPDKARANLQKHRIDVADAVAVFDDPHPLTRDEFVRGQPRYVTIGLDFLGRLLVVVWTLRDEEIRLISARRATRSESKQYQD